MDKLALKIPGLSGTPVQIETPPGIPTGIRIGPLITLVIDALLVVGIILSVAYLAYGGMSWITSRGEKEMLDKARKIITFAIVGLIIMSLSLVIVNVFTTALGVENLIQKR